MNTFTVLCVHDMTLVLLKSNGTMLVKWLSEQFWRCCSCVSSFSETADAEVTRFSLCVVHKRADCSVRQTLIDLRCIASSRTHLALQALTNAHYRLTNIINKGENQDIVNAFGNNLSAAVCHKTRPPPPKSCPLKNNECMTPLPMMHW